MGDTRNHHYIFRGYLRGFAKFKPGQEQKAKVHVSDILKRAAYTTNVRNVAAIRDFNRLDTDEHHPNILEDHLATFESEAAGAIRRVAQSLTFEGEDRNIVLNVIALMATHHPSWRSQLTTTIDQLHRKAANIIFATKDRFEQTTRRMREAEPDKNYPIVDYETMRDFIDRDAYDIVPNQNLLIDLELKAMDHLLPLLGARNWTIWTADDKAGDFVTSDHPVGLMRSDNILANMPLGCKRSFPCAFSR